MPVMDGDRAGACGGVPEMPDALMTGYTDQREAHPGWMP
jgi:hypothetical protein